MKVFVYYHDGYSSDGNEGFEDFESHEAALEFIDERMKDDKRRTLNNYTVIEGKVLNLVAKTVVVTAAFE